MRIIREEPSGQDVDIMLPVIKVNKRELELLLSLLEQADIYIPNRLLPDKSRIRQMIKIIAKYLGVVPRMKTKSLGENKYVSKKEKI